MSASRRWSRRWRSTSAPAPTTASATRRARDQPRLHRDATRQGKIRTQTGRNPDLLTRPRVGLGAPRSGVRLQTGSRFELRRWWPMSRSFTCERSSGLTALGRRPQSAMSTHTLALPGIQERRGGRLDAVFGDPELRDVADVPVGAQKRSRVQGAITRVVVGGRPPTRSSIPAPARRALRTPCAPRARALDDDQLAPSMPSASACACSIADGITGAVHHDGRHADGGEPVEPRR
jgi:hypothetical protein